jgi:hypothetical protein
MHAQEYEDYIVVDGMRFDKPFVGTQQARANPSQLQYPASPQILRARALSLSHKY